MALRWEIEDTVRFMQLPKPIERNHDILAGLSFGPNRKPALVSVRATRLRDAAVIESTESSNRIEGVVAPHHRVEAAFAIPAIRSSA